MPGFSVSAVGASSATSANSTVTVPLGKAGEAVGFSTSSSSSITSIRAALVTAKSAEEQRLATTFESHAEVASAIQAATMWTLIYNPCENGPFMPVSRSWNFAPSPVSNDWT